MAKPDISDLSIVELNEIENEAKDLIIKKRAEELKKLVVDLLKKSEAINFSTAQVIAEIRKRESGTKTKEPKASGGGKKAPNPWKKDMVYCNPEDPTSKEWTGGNHGPKPPWLLALLSKAASTTDQIAIYSTLVKK